MLNVVTPHPRAFATGKLEHFEAVSAAEFSVRPPPEWEIRGLIPGRSITVIMGKSQSRKTFLALEFAACITSGRAFLGRAVRQGVVLYLALEDSFELSLRIKAVIANMTEEESNRFLVSETRVTLPHHRHSFDDLEKFLRQRVAASSPVTVIVIDTYAYLNDGKENESPDTTEILRSLRRLILEFGLSVILIHHPALDNEDRPRGSTALFNGVACVLRVRDEKKGRSSIEVLKNKGAPIGERLTVQFVQVSVGNGATTLKLQGETQVTIADYLDRVLPAKHEPYIQILVAAGPAGLTHGEWADAANEKLGTTLSSFNKALSSLKKDPRVHHDGKKYSLVPVPDQCAGSATAPSAAGSASSGGVLTPPMAPAPK